MVWDIWYKNENITIWYGTCGIKMKILPCDMGSMVYNWQYQMLWDIWYIIKSYENIYLNWKIICKNYLCFNILLSLLCSREKIWKLILKIILLNFDFSMLTVNICIYMLTCILIFVITYLLYYLWIHQLKWNLPNGNALQGLPSSSKLQKNNLSWLYPTCSTTRAFTR